jgi:FixJ family two-component response regulator
VLDLFFMDSKNKLIAVVDDDAGVRQSLERLLNLVGYTVRTFANAPEFLDSIVKDTAHCVVIDVNLGVSSGLDLADHPLVAGGKIPVIFISGAVEDRVRSRATAAGCIALLSKPFKPVELLDAIFRATQSPIPVSTSSAHQSYLLAWRGHGSMGQWSYIRFTPGTGRVRRGFPRCVAR